MKTYLAKSTLILAGMGGTLLGLLMYSDVLFVFSKTVGFKWLSISVVFIISLIILRLGGKILNRESEAVNSFKEINLFRVLKFFIVGFMFCYAGFSAIGGIFLVLFMVFKYFFVKSV
jgi:hypothetical protein